MFLVSFEIEDISDISVRKTCSLLIIWLPFSVKYFTNPKLNRPFALLENEFGRKFGCKQFTFSRRWRRWRRWWWRRFLWTGWPNFVTRQWISSGSECYHRYWYNFHRRYVWLFVRPSQVSLLNFVLQLALENWPERQNNLDVKALTAKICWERFFDIVTKGQSHPQIMRTLTG